MGVDSINAGGETPVTLKKEEQTPARKIRAGVPNFPRIYLLFVFILCNPLILCSHQKNSLSSLVDCDIIIRHLGADGCWCALWSSKPVIAVSSCIGGFNSHTFPPDKKSKGPQTIFVCGPFIVLPFSYRTIRWRHIPVRPQCGQVSLRRVRVW